MACFQEAIAARDSIAKELKTEHNEVLRKLRISSKRAIDKAVKEATGTSGAAHRRNACSLIRPRVRSLLALRSARLCPDAPRCCRVGSLPSLCCASPPSILLRACRADHLGSAQRWNAQELKEVEAAVEVRRATPTPNTHTHERNAHLQIYGPVSSLLRWFRFRSAPRRGCARSWAWRLRATRC